MRWFRRRGGQRAASGSAGGGRASSRPAPATSDEHEGLGSVPFVCSTCGRTDLPPVGDWDPPICQECDAAINFDAIEEEAYFHDR